MPEAAAPLPGPAPRRQGPESGSEGSGVIPFLLQGSAADGEALMLKGAAHPPAVDGQPGGDARDGIVRSGRLAGSNLASLGLAGPGPAAAADAAPVTAAAARSVEAAALAVVRAAAAVEAAAGTVQAAAAAFDRAAALARPAGGAPFRSDPAAAADTIAPDERRHDAGLAMPAALRGPDLIHPDVTQLDVILPPDIGPVASRQGLLRPGAVQPADPRARFRRVAIIHYWLVTMRGGERVLERLLELFPGADIFTHVYDPAAVSAAIRARTVHTSFIQKLPGARRHYQSYLPLMPMALEQLDLRGYDLVISSESGPAKGVIPAPDALHLCYVHSPMRYLWDHYHDYRAEAGWLKRAVMPLLCHGLRQWDTSSAARVDRVLANSHFIRERVAKAWRREAAVVHPPVDPALFAPSDEIEPGYLWVGQLVPYKRADLAIDAFNALGLPLTVVGDGPQAAMLKKRAGPTIRMIPRLDFAALRRAYARCRALVFTAEEDFGIVPVEVMASGRPVVAYGRGGALDSVVEGRTGLFFAEQTTAALVEAVQQMERWLPGFDPAEAAARALDFAPERFDAGVLEALA